MTLGVKKGEILGLLGPNGAGKSTGFNIMAKAMERSDGNVQLFNQDIASSMRFESHLGVCFQKDVMWPYLTVREHIDLVFDVKGYDKSSKNTQIGWLMERLLLKQ